MATTSNLIAIKPRTHAVVLPLKAYISNDYARAERDKLQAQPGAGSTHSW